MHPEPPTGQGIGEGGRQALSQDSHHMEKNKHATRETRSFGQAGRSVFPAAGEQAHQELEEFSRKQLDWDHRTTEGEAAARPPKNRTWFFLSPTSLDRQD